jgi:DNA polymerase-3 subunit beta
MQFSISRQALFGAIKAVAGVVERKNTHPILSNFLLEVKGKQLVVSASNLEMEIRIQVPEVVVASEDFAITLPAKKVQDLLATMPDSAEVSFDIADGHAQMKVGRSRYKLSTLPAEDFPLIDVSNQEASVAVPQLLLSKMIKQTEFAMAAQDVRFYLNGMLFELDNQQLTLVATDGHRLSKASTTLANAQSGKWQLIVPRRTVIELAKAVGDSGDVILGLAKNHLMLTVGDLSMIVKLIEGKFPDYQRVIPLNMPFVLAIDKAPFAAGLSRVAILANEKLRGVRMTIQETQVELTTSNSEQDEADEIIDANFSGNTEITTGFNLRYLQDILTVLPHELAMINFRDGNSACMTSYPLGDEISITQVVMPMRI